MGAKPKMTKWRKSPPELIAAFEAAIAGLERAERRQMFGYPCAFAGGNLFTGLHQESFFVRLPEAERDALLSVKGASHLEPLPGRIMADYVVLPPPVVARPRELRDHVERSLAHALTLPPKERKPPPTSRSSSAKPPRKRPAAAAKKPAGAAKKSAVAAKKPAAKKPAT
jgi:hypothetical protein